MATTRKLEPSEHAIQAAFVEWVRRVENLPQYHALRLSFAVPNGARVGIGQARKLKAEGLRAGIPDWWLPYPLGELGLVIEFKAARGVLSVGQSAYMRKLSALGWRCQLCRSTESAIAAVNLYLGI